MKYILSTLFVLSLTVGVVSAQKIMRPPAPLIYKAPLKADFKEFTAEDKSFSAVFPGVPKTTRSDLDKGIIVSSGVSRAGSNSVVSYYEFQNDIEEIREKVYEFYKNSILKTPKTTIESETDSEVDGRPAREFVVIEDLKYQKIRLLVSGNRFYELRTDVSNWPIISKYNKDRVADFETETARFFASFRLLAEKKKETEVPLDFLGLSDKTTYTNTFFGFSLEFPEDWYNLDPLEIDQSREAGLKMLKTNKEKTDQAFAAAAKKEVIIFGISSKPYGQPGGSILMVSVIKLPGPGITSEMILNNSRDLLTKNPSITLTEDVKNIVSQGKQYSTAQFNTAVNGFNLKQRLFVTVNKGYSVNIMMTYLNDNQAAPLEKIFGTLKFNTK